MLGDRLVFPQWKHDGWPLSLKGLYLNLNTEQIEFLILLYFCES